MNVKLAVGSNPIRGAYFVKLDDTSDHLVKDRVIFSEVASDNYIYLLNAAPGRYAVVAVSVYYRYARSTCLLPKAIVQQTIANVGPGTVGYLGDFLVDTVFFAGETENDEVERHYFNLLSAQGLIRKPVFSANLLSSTRNREGERRFWQVTDHGLLAGFRSGWSSWIREQLGSVGSDKNSTQ